MPFLKRFPTERAAFLQLIEGSAATADRQWYASLLLSRLMFVYFLQKRGFFDGEFDYLRQQLALVRQRTGKDRFLTFLRSFLKRLLPERSGRRERDFERANPDLQIADAAFERLFAFFDEYRWRLDDGPSQADDEIAHDLLGCLFEKHVDRKHTGTYYTGEDVTTYIARSTIIPFLFDAIQGHCRTAFLPAGVVGRLLRDDPERYIYPAVRACHNRCQELRAKLTAGEVGSANDLVTCNLDVGRLAEDVIANCDEPDLLQAIYAAVTGVSVLDPTCGSGAFLFAALNVLAPLYAACLDRMRAFLEARSRAAALSDFRQVLAEAAAHPSQRYFIIRSIIVNNLYGVDLMEEAVEICKLRLLLRLLAEMDKAPSRPSLPAIDFNLRSGNALVGFATLEADMVNRDDLDRRLADVYGVDADQPDDWRRWRESHRPFHWPVEFPSVMQAGGFDVIIGNPPYVESAKVQGEYQVRGYATASCGNLYAYVVERSAALLAPAGRSGMIVPHAAFCTDRMAPLMDLFAGRRAMWVSTYDIRPAKLFAGVDQRLAIFLTAAAARRAIYSTRYHRWYETERPHLFTQLRYTDISDITYPNAIAKIGTDLERRIWKKLQARAPLGNDLGGRAVVYYHNAPRYWIRAMTFAPYFRNERDGEKLSTQVKCLPVRSCRAAAVVAAALNSSLFYWWFILFSDSRHLNRREIERFPLGFQEMDEARQRQLERLCVRLMDDYRRHAVRKECRYRTTGRVVYDEFYPRHSKAIIDEIDGVLAAHHGLTDEERTFIVTYDLKYRLGEG